MTVRFNSSASHQFGSARLRSRLGIFVALPSKLTRWSAALVTRKSRFDSDRGLQIEALFGRYCGPMVGQRTINASNAGSTPADKHDRRSRLDRFAPETHSVECRTCNAEEPVRFRPGAPDRGTVRSVLQCRPMAGRWPYTPSVAGSSPVNATNPDRRTRLDQTFRRGTAAFLQENIGVKNRHVGSNPTASTYGG